MEYLMKTVYFDAYSWIPKDTRDSLIELGLRLSKLSTFIEGEPFLLGARNELLVKESELAFSSVIYTVSNASCT